MFLKTKHMFKILMLTALAVYPFLTASAETEPAGLTIDQAVSHAFDHSPNLKRSQAAKGEAEWSQAEAFSVFLPRISANANHFFETKYQFLNINFGGTPIVFPEVYPATTANFDAALTLFDGLQNYNQYAAASKLASAAELNETWASFALEQEVRNKFYHAIASQVQLSVAEQNLKTLEDHLAKIQVLLKNGAATQFDVLRIEVQLNEASSEKLLAQDNLVLARKQLAESMGLENDETPLTGTLPIPTKQPLPHDLKVDSAGRADILARDLQSEAAERRQSAGFSFWVPKVNLVGEYQFYNNFDKSIGSSDKFRSAYNFGIALTWNIFDGGASFARYKQAAYQAKQAEAQAEAAHLRVPYDFDFWKRRYLYSTALYQARTSDVEKAQESVRLATLGLRAGSRTSTEVLDAELDLFRSRAGAVRAQLDAADARTNLELAVGHKL